jgi:hypothetical protein
MNYRRWTNGLAGLPVVVTCDVCDALAHVPPQSIDEDAYPGQLRGFDQMWTPGFWYTLICPTCGRRKQRVPNRGQFCGKARGSLIPAIK